VCGRMGVCCGPLGANLLEYQPLRSCAQNCAHEGVQVTPNYPPPAKQTNENPSAKPVLTEGFLAGKVAPQGNALPPRYVPMNPVWPAVVRAACKLIGQTFRASSGQI
jgi:hypothetical protein